MLQLQKYDVVNHFLVVTQGLHSSFLISKEIRYIFLLYQNSF
jgi:hypothetical protein